MPIAAVKNQAMTRWFIFVISTVKNYYTGSFANAKRLMRGFGF